MNKVSLSSFGSIPIEGRRKSKKKNQINSKKFRIIRGIEF